MLAPFKSLLAALCLLSITLLYNRSLSSNPPPDAAFAHLNTQNPFDENGTATPEPSNILAPNGTPRIHQATMMFGHNYKGLNERPLQSHAEHAERWGYGNHVLTREIVGAGEIEGEGEWNKYIFSKILYILKIMVKELEKPREERAEWIVWYDADTLIINPNVPWEVFLPPTDDESFSDVKILATKDVSGFNAGLFFCRIDEWVVDVLTDSYALPRLYPEVQISGNIEQNAMKWIFSQRKQKKHIVYQPMLWYNWFSQSGRPDAEAKGDMLVHFSGINHEGEGQMKKDVMETWFNKIQNDLNAWHVPLEETRYPKDVPAFWALFKRAREILAIVKDRGDTSTGEEERLIQVARTELQWTVEEEAFDGVKLKRVMQEMMEALRSSDRAEEQALVTVFGKGDGDESLAKSASGAVVQPAAAAQEAVSPPPEVQTNVNQNGAENVRQRFSRDS